MKTLIISDSHSKNPVDFVKQQADKGIEKLVFLGDCDLPEILEQILALNISKIVLSGNHEYKLSTVSDIDSSSLYLPFDNYVKLWKASKAREFILDPENHLAEKNFGEERVVFCHGCLYSLETSRPLLEGRLAPPLYSADVPYNFETMQQKGYWILFRGHDHQPNVLSVPRQARPFSTTPKNHQGTIEFSKENLYIATVGDYSSGHYAVLDEEKMVLELLGS